MNPLSTKSTAGRRIISEIALNTHTLSDHFPEKNVLNIEQKPLAARLQLDPLGSFQRSPDSPAGLKGKGEGQRSEREGREGKGGERKKMGYREGTGGHSPPPFRFCGHTHVVDTLILLVK